MKRLVIGIPALLGFLWLVLSTSQQIALAHDSGPGSWIRNGNFISPLDGAHCCGEHDCFALDPDDVREAAGGYLIRSLNELVPAREVQWSRDGQYWRCRKADGTRRCFFAPPPAI